MLRDSQVPERSAVLLGGPPALLSEPCRAEALGCPFRRGLRISSPSVIGPRRHPEPLACLPVSPKPCRNLRVGSWSPSGRPAVLKDTLEKRGVLGHLKARIRAEVFSALDDESEPRPPLSHENLIINELIREYLEFNKYKYTASVLISESGQPVVPLDRPFLIRELNAFEESKDDTIPLLYGILAHFLHRTKDDLQNPFLRGSSLQPPNPNLGGQPSRRKQRDDHLQKEKGNSTNMEDPLVSQAVKR